MPLFNEHLRNVRAVTHDWLRSNNEWSNRLTHAFRILWRNYCPLSRFDARRSRRIRARVANQHENTFTLSVVPDRSNWMGIIGRYWYYRLKDREGNWIIQSSSLMHVIYFKRNYMCCLYQVFSFYVIWKIDYVFSSIDIILDRTKFALIFLSFEQ